jgi:hypothetical protein
MIIRETEMDVYLQALALQTDYISIAKVTAEPSYTPFTLDEVYDNQIEALAQAAYATDYTTFGFGRFKQSPNLSRKTKPLSLSARLEACPVRPISFSSPV